MNLIKSFVVVSLLFTSTLYAEKAIVDTNVLLIKKEPSEASVKFGFYKKNDSIETIGEYDGIDNDSRWYKTQRGYVKADYVILEKYLPQFIEESQVDKSKNALQLIVYQSTVVKQLNELRKKLKNETDLYLQKSKKVYVIYLVNFDSYSDALKKKKELNNLFPGSFITKVKKSSGIAKESKSDYSKKRQAVKNIEIVRNDNITNEQENFTLSMEDLGDEDINYDESFDLKDMDINKPIVIEEPIIEEIPRLKSSQKKVSRTISKPKPKPVSKPKVVKTIKKVEKKDVKLEVKKEESFTSLMESLLINLNK
jgi:hypothetical protein